ncbi:flagellar filament capping protein FliD [Sphingomonas sp.]
MTVESIAKTLGTGSGIDIGALVTSLVEAQYANRTKTLDTRQETLTAQISKVSEIKGAITGFSSALNTLASSGSLGTQPTSSRADIVRATALTGARPTNLNATIEVRQLARAQTVQSGSFADRAASVGSGTLTISFGNADAAGVGAFDITIEPGNDSLDAVAAAINAAGRGVSASVVGDGAEYRLMLKGQTGASQAFHIAASDPSLDRLTTGGAGTLFGQAAQDAEFVLDGFVTRRASNVINNALPGVRLDLASASPGAIVTIGSETPVQALGAAVEDVVATYNDLLAMVTQAIDPATGPLRADPAMRSLERSLAQLTSTILLPGAAAGTPRTLAEIGVATNRDGTLRVDPARMVRALAEAPQAIEAMLAPNGGLPQALGAIAAAATNRQTGLGASEQRYSRAQTQLTDERLKIMEQSETLRTRMTQQFASMDAKVAAYKSTQTFLTQQIDAWNAQRR